MIGIGLCYIHDEDSIQHSLQIRGLPLAANQSLMNFLSDCQVHLLTDEHTHNFAMMTLVKTFVFLSKPRTRLNKAQVTWVP